MKCPTCGQELGKFWSDENSMKKHGECFECSLWRERLSLVGNSDVAIIDGTLYTIGDEDSTDPSCRGFGGDKFVINFKDGRKVTTTNLWCGGEISEHWRPQFPDNADFDWRWKKIGDYNYLIPKEETEEIPDELISQAETNVGM